MNDHTGPAKYPAVRDFWHRYFASPRRPPRLRHNRLAELIRIPVGAFSKWIKGENGMSPDHVSALLKIDEEPYTLSPTEVRDLLLLSLAHQHYSDAAISVLTMLGASSSNAAALLDARTQHKRLEAHFEEVCSELDQRRKEAEAHVVLDRLTYALVQFLTVPSSRGAPVTPDGPAQQPPHPMTLARIHRFIYQHALPYLRQMCTEVLDIQQLRGSIYLPRQLGACRDVLKIVWHFGLTGDALEVNKWYGGSDPIPYGLQRGLPGWTYFWGTGRVTDVDHDPEGLYVDAYEPLLGRRRTPEERGYQYVAHVPIPSQASSAPLGVLALDSWQHEFTGHDLSLLTLFARRIGWLLDATCPLWVPAPEA